MRCKHLLVQSATGVSGAFFQADGEDEPNGSASMRRAAFSLEMQVLTIDWVRKLYNVSKKEKLPGRTFCAVRQADQGR